MMERVNDTKNMVNVAMSIVNDATMDIIFYCQQSNVYCGYVCYICWLAMLQYYMDVQLNYQLLGPV